MTHLYLIRHGEAVANVEPIIGGMKGDVGLTPRGVLQAEALRDRLAITREIAADVLIASPLARARQTAEIIAPALGLPIEFDDDVQELLVGEADGLHVNEFKAKYGLPNMRTDPFRPIAPGGEFWAQFVLRVAVTLDRIAREHEEQTVVIVCHGGVIDGSFLCFFGLNTLTVPNAELRTHNTAITHWERGVRDDGTPRWRLWSYNDDFHLRQIGHQDAIQWQNVPAAPTSPDEHTAVPIPGEEE